jgi:hypothetical protein
MNWTLEDYIVVGVLAIIAALVLTLATRKSLSLSYRAGAVIAVFSAMAVFVSAGAVGIIGGEDNVANLLYLGALALGIVGAIVARLQARGLALSMTLVGVAHVLIGAGALLLDIGRDGNAYPYDVIIATAVFGGAFFVSAWLFNRAAPAPLLAV